MRHAARLIVRHRAAKLFFRHFFVRDGFDHVGAGDEHIAGVFDHHREICDRRRIDRAASARPHNRRNLRDDARSQRVAQKDVSVTSERSHAFLNARAARIVQTNHRRADLHRQVHNLADLLRVGFRKRAAEDGEVLREDEDLAPVNQSVAGDEAVAGILLRLHPEIARAVRDQLVELLECAVVEQELDAFTRGHFAFLVLAFDSRFTAAGFGGGVLLSQ
ncbi:MAG: hypothetical protein JMDDDDMK_01063 [Acidobacteria bacterium]|nr:hypothetical protein [Acidobacteriota bacterium]